MSVVLTACQHTPSLVQLQGPAQGSTFHISYYSDEAKDLRPQIDSILLAVDKSMSTYDSTSLISYFNSGNNDVFVDPMFVAVMNESFRIAELTGGAFDVTVAPLVNAWGFGFKKADEVTPALIDSLLQFVGKGKLTMTGNVISRSTPGVMIDFNAIAQGYTVDLIGDFLEAQGISSYFVEVGGELKARGAKPDGTLWKAGIDKPLPTGEADRQLQATLHLDNVSLATSGNYRKFYEKDGHRLAHTIDPRTGYPVEHNLISASVVTKNCMTADALATAFMVMGLEKSKLYLQKHSDIEAYLIYHTIDSGWQTFVTPGLQNKLEEIK